MRTAFVHDWLVTYRGGEKVLEAMIGLYPEAPIFTLFYDPASMPTSIKNRNIIVPRALNKLKPLRKALLPCLPALIESLPLTDYDLIISSSSCVAKGIIPAPHAKHLCYLHSPMRYLWDQRDEYTRELKFIPGLTTAISILSSRLRLWDITSSTRVDRFVANSNFVADRVRRYYNRDASVVHPPIELARFTAGPLPDSKELQDSYFVAAGAFVSYKRFDLAIKACERIGAKLIVAGVGPYEKKLRALGGTTTTFEVSPSDDRWVSLLRGAKALIFPGVEDFGMIAIETMACGTPVIALKCGGAMDFIQTQGAELPTGSFFGDRGMLSDDEALISSLCDTLTSFDRRAFDSQKIRAFANGFSRDHFLTQMKKEIEDLTKNSRRVHTYEA